MARSQERVALAAAIAALKNGERELADAISAQAKSFEHVLDVQGRLDAARAALAEARADADDLADRFISSGGADVLELARSRDDIRERIGVLERELELWRKTHEACQERIPSLEFSARMRREKIDALAGAVMGQALEIATRRYEQLREQATGALAVAEFLHVACHPDAGDERKASARRLHGISEDFRNHLARRPWEAVLARLRADADAVLPEL